MKVLVTGSKGQLGLEVSRQSIIAGYDVIKTDKHDLDITSEQDVRAAILGTRPDVVVNCAAYTHVDACEENETQSFRINAMGAQFLSAAAYNVGAKFFQISTDYVFDGRDDFPKREFDTIRPINVYGQSKAYGETLALQSNPRTCILRTAWLYGEGKNFVRTMLGLAQKEGKVNVVNDQVGTPTSTVDLARCILSLFPLDAYGVFHTTCEGECSWFEFAEKIYQLKGIKTKVQAITTQALKRPAKRPAYSVLENFRLKLLGINLFRPWQEALEEYLKNQD